MQILSRYFNFDINYFFQKIRNLGVIERKCKKDRKIVFFNPQTKIFQKAFTSWGGGSAVAPLYCATASTWVLKK